MINYNKKAMLSSYINWIYKHTHVYVYIYMYVYMYLKTQQ